MSNHLITDFKDRVPTKVLSNGAIRYEQFDSNGNSLGYMWVKRADEPTEVGTAYNKALYDGIKEEFGDVLYTASKASYAEASAGTDNDKYMTPYRVQNYHNSNIGVKYTNISLSSSSTTTINMTNYITAKAKKIEIVFNATLASDNIVMNGTGIHTGNTTTSYTNVTIGRGSTLAKLEIYPDAHFYRIKGYSTGMSEGVVDITGYYTTITSIVVPMSSSSTSYQVSLYQYLK